MMSLRDLEERGFIERIPSDSPEIANLIRLADRHLDDTQVKGLSPDSVLIHAYEAARTLALIALRACNYRPRTIVAAHVTTIDSLKFTLGLDVKPVAQLHTLKNKRHRNIYDSAGTTTKREAAEAVDFALKLKATVIAWLSAKGIEF
jgi:hypothetical protein